jgi:hypothetical protein
LNHNDKETFMATHPATRAAPPAEAVYRRIGWRIIPFLILCYFIAYLDRVNIGFAQLQMKGDRGFFRRGVRLRRGHLFPRLFSVRGAEQSCLAPGWRAGVDRPAS